MDRIASGTLPGGGFFIACGKRRKVACATCKAAAQLECDGCDKPLCNDCAVSPRKGLDYCPSCNAPAWKRWLSRNGHASTMTKAERRAAFRAWARAEPETFLKLVPMSKSAAALAAGKTPHALWLEAGGDAEKYRALLVEHGHLVKKEK